MNFIAPRIPEPLRGRDAGWTAFESVFGSLWGYLRVKVLGLKYFYDADRSPFPHELAYTVGAYTTKFDTRRRIRLKASQAASVHKKYASFDLHWKGIIQDIIGIVPNIYTGVIRYGGFIIGESYIGSPARIGYVPYVDEIEQAQSKGEVYINLGVDQISTLQREQLIAELSPLVPMYFRVMLGYFGAYDSNAFVVGTSMVGGIDIIGVDSPVSSLFTSFITLEGSV